MSEKAAPALERDIFVCQPKTSTSSNGHTHTSMGRERTGMETKNWKKNWRKNYSGDANVSMISILCWMIFHLS
jgi:hypothetical protein